MTVLLVRARYLVNMSDVSFSTVTNSRFKMTSVRRHELCWWAESREDNTRNLPPQKKTKTLVFSDTLLSLLLSHHIYIRTNYRVKKKEKNSGPAYAAAASLVSSA